MKLKNAFLFALILFTISNVISGQEVRISNGSTIESYVLISIPGDWTNSGICEKASLKFTGTTDQTFTDDNTNSKYQTLTVDKASGNVLLASNLLITYWYGLMIVSGNLDLNGKTILLDGVATLYETPGNTVRGASGKIYTAYWPLNAPNAEDVGGLGAIISSPANVGSTKVERSHAPQIENGISRVYNIYTQNNSGLDATLVFNYDESELNGVAEANLGVYQTTDGINWTFEGGYADPENNNVTLTGIDALNSTWTLAQKTNDVVFTLVTTSLGSIDVGGYSAPVTCDLDGDGLLDMLVGKQNGYISHYEQDAIHSVSFTLHTNDFNSIDVGSWSTPTIVDLDSDCLLDLLVGEEDGNINHYEQDVVNSTVFNLVTENFNSIDVGFWSGPTFTDLDKNGLLDFIIGGGDGKISHFQQDAANSNEFTLVTGFFNSIDVGNHAVPTFTDLDQFGLIDLLIGEYYGELHHYEQSTVNSTSFTLRTTSFNSIDVGIEAKPTFTDFDGDGRLDLLIGAQGGNINHWEADAATINYVYLTTAYPHWASENSAIFGGNVTHDHSHLITHRGVCYSSINPIPVLTENLQIMGNGLGEFSDIISGLTPGTVYYTRAFSSSSLGTYYGEVETLFSTDRSPGNVLDFDGIDDYVKISINSPETDYTFELFFKTTDQNAKISSVRHPTLGSANDRNLYLENGNIFHRLWNIEIIGSEGQSYADDTWHHIAVVVESGVGQRIYVDGEQVAEGTKDQSDFDWDTSMDIGYDDGYFEGAIDEVRLWNLVRSVSQIRESIYWTLAGYEPGLLGYWQFNQESGLKLPDYAGGNFGDLINMDNSDWVTSTAPVPYNSTDDGNWSSAPIWNTGQGVPEKDWSRVQVNNEVNLNQNETLIDLSIESVGSLNLPSTAHLTVTGELENKAGTTGLYLESDASATASLIHENPGVNATVERYIPKYVGSAGWHDLSSPVVAQTIRPEFVPNENPMPGSNDFYKFDEPSNYWINTKDNSGNWNTNFEDDFVVGRGYNIAYANDVTKSFAGELNSGDYTFDGATTPAITVTAGKGEGWNLMGNPYPSAIVWDDCEITNIDGAVYTYDGAAGQYVSWVDGVGGLLENGIIPPMNGFFIKASTGASLTIPNDARVHTSNNFYKEKEYVKDLLVLKVEGNGFSDKTFIHFNEEATNDFDSEFDAYKLTGIYVAPQFYTMSGNDKHSINVLPYTSDEIVIPLCLMVGKESSYQISVSENSFWETVDVSLKDLLTGNTYDLRAQTTINLNHSPNNSAERFLLLINGATGFEENSIEDDGIEIYSYGSKIFIKSDQSGEVNISVYNLLGQNLTGFHPDSWGLLGLNPDQTIELDLSGNTGFYLVVIQTDKLIKTKKVFVR